VLEGSSVTADYEDLWSGCWGEMQNVGPVHRHMRRLILDIVRPLQPRSVLDVGCGNGANLQALQQHLGIEDVTGIDLAAGAVEAARKRVRGTFMVKNIELEPPLDRTFDLVLSNQVIEHLHDDDAFLSKLRSMCHGYCLIGTMQGRMRRSEASIGHLRNYTTRGLQEKMQKAGFTIERTIGWGFPFYSPLYRSAIEYIGGNDAHIRYDRKDRFIAGALFHLYKLNSSRRGDVLMVLGKVTNAPSAGAA
jgi:SAM-dependent methyltransferase